MVSLSAPTSASISRAVASRRAPVARGVGALRTGRLPRHHREIHSDSLYGAELNGVKSG